MAWYHFVVIAILSFSLNSLLFRSIMKQKASDPFAQMCALFGLGTCFMIIIGLFQQNIEIPPRETMWYFFLGAVAALIGSYCINTAYKLIEASEVTILASSQRLFSVLAAFFVLGEPFSYYKILGTLIIIFGVIIASWRKHTLKWDKGAFFVIAAALLFSSADILGYTILKHMNTTSFILFSYLLPIFLILPLRPKTIKQLRFYLNPKNGLLILVASAIDTLGYFSFNQAYALSQNASLITPLGGSRVIITVILAALFLGERDNMQKKLIGASIVLVGSSFLFMK